MIFFLYLVSLKLFNVIKIYILTKLKIKTNKRLGYGFERVVLAKNG